MNLPRATIPTPYESQLIEEARALETQASKMPYGPERTALLDLATQLRNDAVPRDIAA